jgi:hypothetical protein
MRRAFGAPPSNALQAIEQRYESPRSLRDRTRDTSQGLPSTRLSTPNDALRSRKTSPIATSLPQRAQFSPQETACSRVIPRCAFKRFNRRRFSSRSDSAITILPQAAI